MLTGTTMSRPTVGTTRGNSMSRKASDGLYKHVAELTDLFTALTPISELAPERMTLAQCMFFLAAATADIAGRPSTMTEIKRAAGPVLGRSLHTTYKLLLDGNVRSEKSVNRQGEGLNWLTAIPDPHDARQKILKLTAEGRKVIQQIIGAIQVSKSERNEHG